MNCWFFVVLLLKYKTGGWSCVEHWWWIIATVGIQSFLLLLPLFVLVLALAASRIGRICCRTLALHRAGKKRHRMMRMILVKEMNLKMIMIMVTIIWILRFRLWWRCWWWWWWWWWWWCWSPCIAGAHTCAKNWFHWLWWWICATLSHFNILSSSPLLT